MLELMSVEQTYRKTSNISRISVAEQYWLLRCSLEHRLSAFLYVCKYMGIYSEIFGGLEAGVL